jgi:ubiquitin C-terminal hydrolase
LVGGDRYRCESCKSLQDSEKKLIISKLPEVTSNPDAPILILIISIAKVAIVQLKRFRYDSYFSSKIGTHVICPLDNLDLSRFCKNPLDAKQSSLYELYGIINHRGGLGGIFVLTIYTLSCV